VNFGPLAAEIVSLVWGTHANFNGFRVLAALLHGTLVVGVSQTAALNGGRHLYSAERPSRWALTHISSSSCFRTLIQIIQAFNVERTRTVREIYVSARRVIDAKATEKGRLISQ